MAAFLDAPISEEEVKYAMMSKTPRDKSAGSDGLSKRFGCQATWVVIQSKGLDNCSCL